MSIHQMTLMSLACFSIAEEPEDMAGLNRTLTLFSSGAQTHVLVRNPSTTCKMCGKETEGDEALLWFGKKLKNKRICFSKSLNHPFRVNELEVMNQKLEARKVVMGCFLGDKFYWELKFNWSIIAINMWVEGMKNFVTELANSIPGIDEAMRFAEKLHFSVAATKETKLVKQKFVATRHTEGGQNKARGIGKKEKEWLCNALPRDPTVNPCKIVALMLKMGPKMLHTSKTLHFKTWVLAV
ncbi:hypothetical protein MKW98_011677 [Papaver atlanticum]|uniref:Uncharacterized protein n=1 Tax=Papaver atlanticum TaxID=357466 RepID=A0AAD4S7S4_9MAGN|nr:hypothetical protein MKW98_011677 [Papaver atlanticum]